MNRFWSIVSASFIFCGVGVGVWLYYGDSCGLVLGSTQHHFIMTAFSPETQAVIEEGDVRAWCRNKGITYRLVRFAPEVQAVLFEGGVGPSRASVHAEQTLRRFSVQSLIFSGVAGARTRTFPLGATVVPDVWLNLQTGERISVSTEIGVRVEELGGVSRVPLGATATYFVEDSTIIPEAVTVVDMETYFVARVAEEYAVPFVAFRSVSDYADGVRSEDAYVYASRKSARAVRAYLERLTHEADSVD